MKRFRIILEPDGDSLLVTCPALPEVTTFGQNEADAVVHAGMAIEEALGARIAVGAEIPDGDPLIAPRPEERILFGEISAMAELKVELYQALRAAGITRAELARRLNWHRNSVDRLFRLDHASKIEQIEAAAFALGKRLRVEIVEYA
jgi:antitoxin HicB